MVLREHIPNIVTLFLEPGLPYFMEVQPQFPIGAPERPQLFRRDAAEPLADREELSCRSCDSDVTISSKRKS
jgi:hypothetical protein